MQEAQTPILSVFLVAVQIFKINGIIINQGYIDNITTPCPRCGHVEKWQIQNIENNVENSAQENYPQVYRSFDEADFWATNLLRTKIASIVIEQRKIDMDSVTSEIEQITEWLNKEQALFLSDPVICRIREMGPEYEKAHEDLKNTGAFAFSEKNRLKNLIMRLDHDTRELRPKLEKLNSDFDRKTIDKIIRRDHLDLLKYGPTNDPRQFGDIKTALGADLAANLPEEVIKERQQFLNRFNIKSETSEVQENKSTSTDTTEEQVFCRYCGNKLPESAVFCNKCGKQIK